MSTYTPDVWVVLEFATPTETFHKVLAGWYGGFAGSNSWKLNSGITEVRRDGDWMEFRGHSGSVYRGKVGNYHMSSLMHSIYSMLLKQSETQGVTIRILDIDEVLKM